MKVLTIRQPWATLIMQGDKEFEFRSWKTNYRGDLLIHSGKVIDKDAMQRLAGYISNDIPIGKILGKVTLVDCIKCDDNFRARYIRENNDIYAKSIFKGEYAWMMKNMEMFDVPIEVKGKLGLWEYEM